MDRFWADLERGKTIRCYEVGGLEDRLVKVPEQLFAQLVVFPIMRAVWIVGSVLSLNPFLIISVAMTVIMKILFCPFNLLLWLFTGVRTIPESEFSYGQICSLQNGEVVYHHQYGGLKGEPSAPRR